MSARDVIGTFGGRGVPGGCEDCHAYQELDQIAPGVYGLTVRHDHTCPTLRRMVLRRAQGDS